jgi:hypothetical protein
VQIRKPAQIHEYTSTLIKNNYTKKERKKERNKQTKRQTETYRKNSGKFNFRHPVVILVTKVLYKPSIATAYFVPLYIFLSCNMFQRQGLSAGINNAYIY